MRPSPIEYLQHILDECNYLLQEYQSSSYEDLLTNKRLSNAVCRSLEIIGEATKRVDDSIRLKYPEVKWKKMAGIPDILIHNYFGIDYKIVWRTIDLEIPPLKKWIENILEKESNENNKN